MSTQSTTPFFGRAYQLSVIPATDQDNEIIISSDIFEPEALRFTFNVEQSAFASGCAYWFADVEIFNCDSTITYGPSKGETLAAELMTEGSMVIIKAGYQADGEPQVIWQGPVFQAIWDRLDVVDFRLTLRCVLNRVLGNNNFVSATFDSLSKSFEQAQRIASESVRPFNVDSAQLQLLTNRQLPRAKTIFGNPHRYLSAMAKQDGLGMWMTSDGIEIAELSNPDVSVDPDVTYGPASPLDPSPIKQQDGTTLSLIGTPQQTQLGITFKVLLDSRLKVSSPLKQIAIDMKYIRQGAVQFGVFPPRQLIDQYMVVGVRHFGDTRGNDWYTEAICVVPGPDLVAILGG